MSARPTLHAFIDESGQRGRRGGASKHFIMSAAAIPEDRLADASDWLAKLRTDLGRRPGDVLHFQNLKQHSLRLHAAQQLGNSDAIKVMSVVVCKEHLPALPVLNDDQAYLFTFRLLLERLSWYARDKGFDLKYTLAHVVRFKMAKLREYEERLRDLPEWECKIAWHVVDPAGGSIDQPSRVEFLQVADLAASGIGQAFEPDQFGNTEDRYLRAMLPCVWRRGGGANGYTTYGLKMHPWSDSTKAAYPWVAAL